MANFDLPMERNISLKTTIIVLLAAIVGGATMLSGNVSADKPAEFHVVALGSVVSDSSTLDVRSEATGVIADIRVRDGETVDAGTVLLRLDNAALQGTADEAAHTLDALVARRARLAAEHGRLEKVSFPASLADRSDDPYVANLIAMENALFEERKMARQSEVEQLNERVAKLQNEVVAYKIQAAGKDKELSYVKEQLRSARDLRAKSLMPTSTLLSLEREAVRLESERDGVLGASIAQAEGRIAESRFTMLQVQRERAQETLRELSEADAKLAEAGTRQRAGAEQLRRLEVKAPAAGIVRLQPDRAIGMRVADGEGVVKITRQDTSFVVDAAIAQADIAALRVGQDVKVQLSTPDRAEPAELIGTLSGIGPVADTHNKQLSYRARIALASSECQRVGPVQPGMEARVTLVGERRSKLASAWYPVGDRIARALQGI
ncbi:MAG TPA: HlyD family efflux transporter periplasmic adaptor subunit [Hyphomicrobium sp.]|nr:HlyD family efflux transporter periplasmic adaptor subunit [Hyphomicrobium sp.]